VKDRNYLELAYRCNVSKLLRDNIEDMTRNYGFGQNAYEEKDYDAFVISRIDELESSKIKSVSKKRRATAP
jgi:hypothetical protein